jgi:acetoin utilization protein AcuB
MNVSDLMTANPITVVVDETLLAALEKMDQHGIHHLPVLSKSKHLIGILSDRDCRRALQKPFTERAYWQHEVVERIIVRDVMTTAPITISDLSSTYEAARLMLLHHIGCLPVMRDETLVGIITRNDLLMAYVQLGRQSQRLSASPVDLYKGVHDLSSSS